MIRRLTRIRLRHPALTDGRIYSNGKNTTKKPTNTTDPRTIDHRERTTVTPTGLRAVRNRRGENREPIFGEERRRTMVGVRPKTAGEAPLEGGGVFFQTLWWCSRPRLNHCQWSFIAHVNIKLDWHQKTTINLWLLIARIFAMFQVTTQSTICFL